MWLEDYLSKYPKTLIVVSHSQDFLNSVCTNIMHLWDGQLEYYGGNYDTFARRSSAEHLIATKALRCTAAARMLTAAESFAKF